MAYWRMAALVTCSAGAAIYLAASIATTIASARFARWADRRGAASRASVLFQFRMLPPVAAVVGAAAVVLPLFLWFEPADTHERVPVTLTIGAAAAVVLAARAIWRALETIRVTHALARRWRAKAARVESLDAPLPIFAIDDGFPTIAVVGFRRPALFVATQVLRACSADEVRAMLSHECAHVASRDNVKRLLLRSFPPRCSAGRRIEGAWERASEEAADAAAARDAALALPLAQALVRVARLAPATRFAAPVSAFYPGGAVDARVRRLLEPVELPQAPLLTRRTVWLLTLLGLGTLLIAAPTLHTMLELVIAALP